MVVPSLVVCVDNDDEKDLRRIQSLALVPVTATYEAESTVEVWSLWPCKSTCTEITGFYMIFSGLHENLV